MATTTVKAGDRIYIENPNDPGRPWGVLEYGPNGWLLRSLVEDPPELGLQASKGGSLGKIRFDWLRPDGATVEVVNIQGKVDERIRAKLFQGIAEGRSGAELEALVAGEVTVHIKRTGFRDDPASVPVILLRSDEIVRYVPIREELRPDLGGGSGDGAQRMTPGTEWRSPNGRVMLAYQGSDRNLVLYVDGAARWASNTAGLPPGVVEMQGDGNFTMTVDGVARWASGTEGHPGAQVVVTDAGAQIVHDGSVVWARP